MGRLSMTCASLKYVCVHANLCTKIMSKRADIFTAIVLKDSFCCCFLQLFCKATCSHPLSYKKWVLNDISPKPKNWVNW